ncbi:uncharacterized protein LOC107271064 isoform X2 [Cephus cinctus]|uniref:Uncharacterized protein LOC107271064 isoform X2 n=1 Tax=Cephus cinctus TaxID=211228 RepID=A0AAJ7W4D0_CEPCN|nr:uncharacterized protein LOC107271064 isoform X2 [Cephus cinctus]
MSYDATWCPICDKQVSSKCRDTNELLQHIRKCHSAKSRDNPEYQCSLCYHKLHKSRSRLGLLKNKINRLSHPELISRNASMSMRKKKIFSTKVETWKWHSRRLLCPSCNQESAPLISVKQHKFTSSHLGALCLLGCWPLCFMPLTTSRDKRTRMVCPVCGYDYGARVGSKCSLLQGCGKQLPEVNPAMRKFTENKSTTCFGYPERKLHFEQIPVNMHKYDIMGSGCRSRNNFISSARNPQCHQHQFIDELHYDVRHRIVRYPV